ncbi:MAG: hypothetical protein IPP51_07855 [Bacteroidetes bacterium]|nr:hypothetical protein [Bacteroidota bacterium]
MYLSVMLAMAFTSCRHKTDLSSLKQVSFANDIQPIIASNCAMSGCHSTGSSGGEHELFPLTTYEEVIDEGHVKAGDAHGSKFYQVISNHTLEDVMPPSPYPPLSDDQIKLIYLWIEQGAQNN